MSECMIKRYGEFVSETEVLIDGKTYKLVKNNIRLFYSFIYVIIISIVFLFIMSFIVMYWWHIFVTALFLILIIGGINAICKTEEGVVRE